MMPCNELSRHSLSRCEWDEMKFHLFRLFNISEKMPNVRPKLLHNSSERRGRQTRKQKRGRAEKAGNNEKSLIQQSNNNWNIFLFSAPHTHSTRYIIIACSCIIFWWARYVDANPKLCFSLSMAARIKLCCVHKPIYVIDSLHKNGQQKRDLEKISSSRFPPLPRKRLNDLKNCSFKVQ